MTFCRRTILGCSSRPPSRTSATTVCVLGDAPFERDVLPERIAFEPHARERLVHHDDWLAGRDVRRLEVPAADEPRLQGLEVIRRNDSLFDVAGTIREPGIREPDASVPSHFNRAKMRVWIADS